MNSLTAFLIVFGGLFLVLGILLAWIKLFRWAENADE